MYLATVPPLNIRSYALSHPGVWGEAVFHLEHLSNRTRPPLLPQEDA